MACYCKDTNSDKKQKKVEGNDWFGFRPFHSFRCHLI